MSTSPSQPPDLGRTSPLPEDPAPDPSPSPTSEELRLVLLGRTASGKSAAGNAILGREAFASREGNDGAAVTQECEKRRGFVAGRRVALIDTPDWFCSKRPAEEVRRQISECAALSAPGPHAFLLCVPLDRPAEVELQALGALGEVFGPGAVGSHTLVLFTHADQVAEPGGAEEYIANLRDDLLELTERCGNHYHVLEAGGGAEEGAESSVRSLLEKVEQTVREGGGAHYTSGLFQEAEARVRQRQEEIMKERRERGEGGEGEEKGEEKGEEQEREEEQAREEAERSVHDLTLDTLPSLFFSAPPPSFLRSIWETLVAWVQAVTKYVRGGALLGSVVGMLVGGPLGSALGATVGSVATEVGRRKQIKKQ